MKKAVQVMEIGGKITLSDDSGLEIDYMDKAPGIYSARFMGEDTPYPERFKAIFEKLNGVPCVLTFLITSSAHASSDELNSEMLLRAPVRSSSKFSRTASFRAHLPTLIR